MGIVKDVLKQNTRAAARLMRDLDDRLPRAVEQLKALYPHTGKAAVIGITGNPGCGKSTLVDAMVRVLRQAHKRVGVVAVDPSSPFSGGAILGDRIRMQKHALDDGVFIRSLASRGYLGGLSRSTMDVVTVLDAMGFEYVLVETVGVGQAEVDIVEAAHVSVVVVAPGLGDEVQAMKAGVLEIADVLLVNKADRPGADRAVQDLQQMLHLRQQAPKTPPVLSTAAVSGHGVAELIEEIDRQLGNRDSARWQDQLRRRAKRQVVNLLREQLTDAALDQMGDELDQLLAKTVRRELDPYSLVEIIVQRIARV